MEDTTKSIDDVVRIKISNFKKKANHNKNETLLSFKLIMVSTLLSPLFIAFGTTLLYGKIVPAILSLIAAASTAWLQLRKPQQLWGLYRTSQRKLENELELFQFDVGIYDKPEPEKSKKLLLITNDIFMETHKSWVGIIPDSEELLDKKSDFK